MITLDAARSRLLARRTEIAERARRTAAELRREHEPLSADFGEQAVQRENDEVLQNLDDAARSELQRINRALARIERGEYLRCVACGAPITASRLEAVPDTDGCIACA